MLEKVKTAPKINEFPSEYADRLGIIYTTQVSVSHKKIKGQFFTPTPIAKLMASLCDLKKNSLRILDPGCGTAILSCALIEKFIGKDVDYIELVAYESDPEIISYTNKVLKYLKDWLRAQGIEFKFKLHISDFILDNEKALSNNYHGNKFDLIISNPPYFKLAKDDERAIAAKVLISGQPNIYSIFMGLSAKLLVEGGQLIFITPRSFASGNYFKAFRELFFNTVRIDKIHLFNSRKETFNRDSVLQETVIVSATKDIYDPTRKVIISSSSSNKDISDPTIKYFDTLELIDLNSKEKILHLPINDKEEAILNLIYSWSNHLSDFNIQVSTGPVVSFRALDFIENEYKNGIVFLAPLIWLHNVDKMNFEWPKNFKNKGQYIKIEKGSMSILIPNKDYILLRRFSTKDDKSRLIAAPYFSSSVNSEFIGVENKVNYIYRKKGQLNRNELIGLCALLNSQLLNNYFQIFNGNVNVSATELREMRFPPLNIIIEIGNEIINSNDFSMTNVNRIVNDFFEFSSIF